ncbi:hypothetical protein [Methanothermococcus sp.]|nr:hypothetical protein [Methanothermococcus sp.]
MPIFNALNAILENKKIHFDKSIFEENMENKPELLQYLIIFFMNNNFKL